MSIKARITALAKKNAAREAGVQIPAGPSDGLFCLAQHFKVFCKQAAENRMADFAEPCERCTLLAGCNLDWQSKVLPIYGSVGAYINLCQRGSSGDPK